MPMNSNNDLHKYKDAVECKLFISYLIFKTLKALHTSLTVSLNCCVYIQKDPKLFPVTSLYTQYYLPNFTNICRERGLVVWRLFIINFFNKTEAAIFSLQTILPENFLFFLVFKLKSIIRLWI